MGLNLLLVKRKKKDWCISSSSSFPPISPTEKDFDICPWRIAAVVNSSNSKGRKKPAKSWGKRACADKRGINSMEVCRQGRMWFFFFFPVNPRASVQIFTSFPYTNIFLLPKTLLLMEVDNNFPFTFSRSRPLMRFRLPLLSY